MTRHLTCFGIFLAVLAAGACNGVNGNYDADEPSPQYVTVTMANPGTLWLEDLPLIEIRRGRSAGHYGYEVWFEVEGTRQVQFWRRTAIDLGDGVAVPDHAGRWGTFNGQKIYYPGAITAETAPRIHDSILWIEQNFRGQAKGGIKALELFGIVATVGSLAPASAGSSAPALGGATTKALPAGRSVWSLGWAERGRRIAALRSTSTNWQHLKVKTGRMLTSSRPISAVEFSCSPSPVAARQHRCKLSVEQRSALSVSASICRW